MKPLQKDSSKDDEARYPPHGRSGFMHHKNMWLVPRGTRKPAHFGLRNASGHVGLYLSVERLMGKSHG